MNRSKHAFELVFLAGLFGAAYLYIFAFDDFSETELVRLSYLWVSAVVFGTHGLIATEVKEIMTTGEADDEKAALNVRKAMNDRSVLSKLASLLIWSYLVIGHLVSWKRPWGVASMGALVWLGGLAFFFETIFPAL